MVLWCKKCTAFMGLRDPVTNWSVDKSAICQTCLEKDLAVTNLRLADDTAVNTPLPTNPLN